MKIAELLCWGVSAWVALGSCVCAQGPRLRIEPKSATVGSTVTVRAEGADRRPLAGLTIELGHGIGSSAPEFHPVGKTDADGELELSLPVSGAAAVRAAWHPSSGGSAVWLMTGVHVLPAADGSLRPPWLALQAAIGLVIAVWWIRSIRRAPSRRAP